MLRLNMNLFSKSLHLFSRFLVGGYLVCYRVLLKMSSHVPQFFGDCFC